MWDWGQGLDFEYFGVPWANFWAWFWVVFCFSLGLRMIRRYSSPTAQWLAPFGAILIGLMGVVGTNYLIVYVVPRVWYEFTVFIVLGLALLGEMLMRPIRIGPPPPLIVFWVPMVFHIFFLVAGLLSGSILQPPFLLFMSLLMLWAALYLHRPWSWVRQKVGSVVD
jgi:hypothetical protein